MIFIFPSHYLCGSAVWKGFLFVVARDSKGHEPFWDTLLIENPEFLLRSMFWEVARHCARSTPLCNIRLVSTHGVCYVVSE